MMFKGTGYLAKPNHTVHHKGKPFGTNIADFYRTRVRSLGMLVSDSLTNSLTPSCLVNLIDVTLACEDANSKLVEVVTVVEVDDEKGVNNSLVQIWKVNIGHKVKFLFGL